VRWNGHEAETSVDWFSRNSEFEGYHAYLSTIGSVGSFARVGSYDVEDYCRYRWDFDLDDWTRLPYRFMIDEVMCRYAPFGCDDQNWHPMDYSRQQPFVMTGFTDSLFYFEPILVNASEFGLETPFTKRFPAALCPTYGWPSEVPDDSVDFYLTDDGYFKYYEYEFMIDELLPGQTYWIAITSYEYGSLAGDIEPSESNVAVVAQTAVPMAGPFCCSGRVGNANGSGGDEPTIGDVAVMVDAKFISGTCVGKVVCMSEADINQSGGVTPICDDLSIGDISILIDYLFITGESLGLPDCL
jgi:hypothetical protein